MGSFLVPKFHLGTRENRALGDCASYGLANPTLPTMKDTINAKIRRREFF